MSDRYFAIVGSWGHIAHMKKGLSVFRYDPETAEMEHLSTGYPDAYIGGQEYDPDTGIVYFLNEIHDRRGEIAGGGYVLAAVLDSDKGRLEPLCERESLVPCPAGLWIDKSKKYLVVANHGSHGHTSKIVTLPDGTFTSIASFDDAGVALYRVREDGSLGDICDYVIHRRDGGRYDTHGEALPHSVYADPTGELYIVCDRGLDKIYTYHIDRERGKLRLLHIKTLPDGDLPRYAAYHPTLPVVYTNNERRNYLYIHQYDPAVGELETVATVDMLLDPTRTRGVEKVEPSDLRISKDGKHLYAAIRGVNLICVFDVDDRGGLTLTQNISTEGENPRGINLSPDGRFLLVANMEGEANVAAFAIAQDGRLAFARKTPCVAPGNIQIVQAR